MQCRAIELMHFRTMREYARFVISLRRYPLSQRLLLCAMRVTSADTTNTNVNVQVSDFRARRHERFASSIHITKMYSSKDQVLVLE